MAPYHTTATIRMADNLPIFSEGEEVETLSEKVSSLLVIGGGRWTLSKDRKGIERDFQFSTFKKTWVRVFDLCFALRLR